METIFVGVGVIVEDNNKFLVVEENTTDELSQKTVGTLSFPSGHVIPGESIEATAAREVKEETGLLVEAEFIIGFYIGPYSFGIGIKSKIIESNIKQNEQEIKQIYWMTKEEIEINKNRFRPGQLIGYKDYLAGKNYPLNIIRNLIP